MGCDHIRGKGPDGVPFDAFICSRGSKAKRCAVTGCTSRTSSKLCDFPLAGRKANATCDRPICDAHSHRMGETQRVEGGARIHDTIDYCPTHFELSKSAPTGSAAK